MPYRVQRHVVVQPLDPSIRYIPLTQGKHAIVDADLFDYLSRWNWCATFNPVTQRWYAIRNGSEAEGRRPIQMHRVVLDAPPEFRVDHKSIWATLDNRRSNLRLATTSQNGANAKLKSSNTSGFTGVSWCGTTSRWRATIKVNWKRIHLGRFDTPQEAAAAYNSAAIKYFGEFARLNELP